MASKTEITVEEKLKALYQLQIVDSEIDKIRILRGELPLEVQDLEDEIEGLQTRVKNFEDEIKSLQGMVQEKKGAIKESEGLIKKYEDQQMKVRNSREFDSISKEIEYQNLEIQLSEKRIKEYSIQLSDKKLIIEDSKAIYEGKMEDLELKKSELDAIISDTKKDEEKHLKKSEKIEKLIEDRLLNAYKRIRGNARNGLSVVSVERDACGGCFNKLPPQKQLDVASRKKIIVCEHCGRILVDKHILEKPVEE
ncbi:MAG: C4-type zinc ribbon domain-containing protein [Bacteroidota bacterium]